MKSLNTKYIIETAKARIAAKTATTQDYILYAIARAYRNAESEGEANYLSTKYVLAQTAAVTNPNKLRCQLNNDPFRTIRSRLKTIAATYLIGLRSDPYWQFLYNYGGLSQIDTETLKFAAQRLIEAFDRQYLYIFVRQDIIPEQQAVQAAHATFVAGQMLQEQGVKFSSDYTHFVLIGVPGLVELHQARDKANAADISVASFFEGDMDDELTAFTAGVVTQEKRAVFKEYGLLKMGNTKDVDY